MCVCAGANRGDPQESWRGRLRARSHNFRFTATCAPNARGADLTLRYTIEGSSIHVTLEEVREHDAFELISIAMPSLVCIDEDEHDAWLAHGDAGGDMVALREDRTGKLGLNTFWGEVNGILPVIMAGHSGAVCVQETTAFMDRTLLSVMLAAGLKGRGLSIYSKFLLAPFGTINRATTSSQSLAFTCAAERHTKLRASRMQGIDTAA
jgi:hypothetical protein